MWHRFDKKKPKKNGWYQCTVEVPGLQRYVMDLYWYSKCQRFKDIRRLDIFESYKVYGWNDETHKQDKLLTSNRLCDRTENVIAWRKMPRAYMKGFVERRFKNEF